MRDLFAVRPSYSERIVTGDNYHTEVEGQRFQYFLESGDMEKIGTLVRIITENHTQGQIGIITSPQVKAQLNAEAFAEGFKLPKESIVIDPLLVYDGSGVNGEHQRPRKGDLRTIFKKAGQYETAVVVTHRPTIQYLEAYLQQHQRFRPLHSRNRKKIDEGQALHFRISNSDQMTYHLVPEPELLTTLVGPKTSRKSRFSYTVPSAVVWIVGRKGKSPVIPRETIEQNPNPHKVEISSH